MSWATSTKRRVKYPESAVLKAVSTIPLRPPRVPIKNSVTLHPSIKFDLTGISIVSPVGLAIKPRIPASWLNWLAEPRAPEFIIMKIGFIIFSLAIVCSSCEISDVALAHNEHTVL